MPFWALAIIWRLSPVLSFDLEQRLSLGNYFVQRSICFLDGNAKLNKIK
jgi:hypothetical protein